ARRAMTASSTGSAVLVGAGDVAWCSSTEPGQAARGAVRSADVIRLVLDQAERMGRPAAVFALGDLAYPDGSESAFECFDRAWGVFAARPSPAVGNHDYMAREPFRAAPYFAYFSRRGPIKPGMTEPPGPPFFYSYDIGPWHVLVLDSNCYGHGECTP